MRWTGSLERSGGSSFRENAERMQLLLLHQRLASSILSNVRASLSSSRNRGWQMPGWCVTNWSGGLHCTSIRRATMSCLMVLRQCRICSCTAWGTHLLLHHHHRLTTTAEDAVPTWFRPDTFPTPESWSSTGRTGAARRRRGGVQGEETMGGAILPRTEDWKMKMRFGSCRCTGGPPCRFRTALGTFEISSLWLAILLLGQLVRSRTDAKW
jgi:hypothetical protein